MALAWNERELEAVCDVPGCGVVISGPNDVSFLERAALHERTAHPEIREARVKALIAECGLENVQGLTREERERYAAA